MQIQFVRFLGIQFPANEQYGDGTTEGVIYQKKKEKRTDGVYPTKYSEYPPKLIF